MVTGFLPFSFRDGVFTGYVLRKHRQDNFDKHALTPLQLVKDQKQNVETYNQYLSYLNSYGKHKTHKIRSIK
jgi:hypothetical protein